jgi:hypothetical protein
MAARKSAPGAGSRFRFDFLPLDFWRLDFSLPD